MKTQWRALQLGRSRTKVRMQAMAEGVRALGGEVVDPFSGGASYDDAAMFAFTNGMLEGEREEREHLAMIGVPVIVLDCGYFNRAKSAGDPNGYNQVGFNGLCWTPPIECPPDRFNALGLPVAEFPRGFGAPRTALVLGQVPHDTQHGLNEEWLARWLREAALKFREMRYHIIYRPHPKAKGFDIGIDCEVQRPDKPLEESLGNIGRVITFNSTGGLEAIRQGIGVTCSIHAHYYPISGYGFDLCTREKVLSYFYKLAYSQWTTAELATGEPLKFLNTIRRILP